jgi:hypothetical protein
LDADAGFRNPKFRESSDDAAGFPELSQILKLIDTKTLEAAVRTKNRRARFTF